MQINNITMIKNIKRSTLLSVLLVFFITTESFAQQDVQLTQYASALQLTNPAYVGTSGRLNVTGIARNQWVGFDGAPTSQVLLINTPFLRYKFGLGLTLIRDEIGPTTNTLVYLNAAYNFHITSKLKVSMGLSGGFNANNLNAASFNPASMNDPAINFEKQTEFLPNFGTGIYLYSDKFYLGLSTPKLLKNDYSNVEIENTSGEEQHFFLISGYLFSLSDKWKAKPSFSLKMVKGSPLSLDVTANAIYNDKIWFGLMYRVGDAAGAIFQYQVTDRLRAGYSYDLPLTEMKSSGGSHEILVSYDLIFKGKKIVTPRYF
jgi:type IX secretion system PorP/SprF family membrane protein